MRLALIFFSVCIIFSCAVSKKTTMNSGKLNGSWTPISEELGGAVIPSPGLLGQKLIIKDTTYEFHAESVDKGKVKYQADKMDIYGLEGVNVGKHFTAIYKYENEQLSICYNLMGTAYPEAFETKGHPLYFLAVFKKD